ncbi:MAG: cytochrome o ubiquinol oxidase subunit IV [Candidatus Saccharibacteria bacterium]|nr:cytochrome o ubiquinol oxidase subunit IV [Candidatus Saccharibacteria bacterium]
MSTYKQTRRSYIIGYILSIVFTIAAFTVVGLHLSTHHQMPSDQMVMASLMVFAVCQLIVQVIFFLHLGKEPKPRLNLLAFLFMIMVIVIIVFGSLWIMKNLNYHMLHGTDVDKYIIQDEGIHN